MGKTALVLEGGGMRGIFTAGVLEAFLERNLSFDDLYGVSSGATAAVAYLSGQKGRNKRAFSNYVNDPRYKGVKHLVKTGSYFNKEFIFSVVPNQLDPFDYKAYAANTSRLFTPATNCETGEIEYFKVPADKQKMRLVLEAATSLPLMSPPVMIGEYHYLDGGIAEPLILDKVCQLGYDKIVYILTQKRGYHKKPERFLPLIRIVLAHYPQIIKRVKARHDVYNALLRRIEDLAQSGKIILLRPNDHFNVGRVEHHYDSVIAAFDDGYKQGLSLTL